MAKRALITGITGQDGPILAEHLLGLGYQVTGLVRGQNNPRCSGVEEALPDVRFVAADLLDAGSLIRAIADEQPDEIYHLAAHRRGNGDSNELIGATTGLGAERLFESVRIVGGLTPSTVTAATPRIFHASSYESFGDRQTPVDETSPATADSPHGAAKAYAHAIAGHYRRHFGMHITRGILFEHVSPRAEFASVRSIAAAVAAATLRGDITIDVDDSATCDIGLASDYVRAMHLSLQQPSADDYVISSGQTHTHREFATYACRLAGVATHRIRSVPSQASRVSIASGVKARIVLDWAPRATFADVVKTVLAIETRRERENRAEPTLARRRVQWRPIVDEPQASQERVARAA